MFKHSYNPRPSLSADTKQGLENALVNVHAVFRSALRQGAPSNILLTQTYELLLEALKPYFDDNAKDFASRLAAKVLMTWLYSAGLRPLVQEYRKTAPAINEVYKRELTESFLATKKSEFLDEVSSMGPRDVHAFHRKMLEENRLAVRSGEHVSIERYMLALEILEWIYEGGHEQLAKSTARDEKHFKNAAELKLHLDAPPEPHTEPEYKEALKKAGQHLARINEKLVRINEQYAIGEKIMRRRDEIAYALLLVLAFLIYPSKEKAPETANSNSDQLRNEYTFVALQLYNLASLTIRFESDFSADIALENDEGHRVHRRGFFLQARQLIVDDCDGLIAAGYQIAEITFNPEFIGDYYDPQTLDKIPDHSYRPFPSEDLEQLNLTVVNFDETLATSRQTNTYFRQILEVPIRKGDVVGFAVDYSHSQLNIQLDKGASNLGVKGNITTVDEVYFEVEIAVPDGVKPILYGPVINSDHQLLGTVVSYSSGKVTVARILK